MRCVRGSVLFHSANTAAARSIVWPVSFRQQELAAVIGAVSSRDDVEQMAKVAGRPDVPAVVMDAADWQSIPAENLVAAFQVGIPESASFVKALPLLWLTSLQAQPAELGMCLCRNISYMLGMAQHGHLQTTCVAGRAAACGSWRQRHRQQTPA